MKNAKKTLILIITLCFIVGILTACSKVDITIPNYDDSAMTVNDSDSSDGFIAISNASEFISMTTQQSYTYQVGPYSSSGGPNTYHTERAYRSFRLTNNIDLSGYSSSLGSFAAKLDGAGYTVSNFKEGLFSENSGEIYNLNISDVEITRLPGNTSKTIGVLCDINEGLIANISINNVTIQPTANNNKIIIGGICGVNTGKIYQSYAKATINVFNPLNEVVAGVLVGDNDGEIISSFAAESALKTEFAREDILVGEICGSNSGKIVNSFRSALTVYNADNIITAFSNRLGRKINDLYLKNQNWVIDNLGWANSVWSVSDTKYPRVISGISADAINTSLYKRDYPIENVDDLKNITKDLSASYYLINDIDLDGNDWIPLGLTENPSGAFFSGTLDGNGFSIKNFNISGNHRYLGLFGFTTGNFLNLSVEDFTITANRPNNMFIGGLAGVLFGGQISNVYVDGQIIISNTSSNIRAGLLVALNREGTIKTSYTQGSIFSETKTNAAFIGGLVAWNQQNDSRDTVSIEACFSVAELICAGDNVTLDNIIGYNDGLTNKLYYPSEQKVQLNGLPNSGNIGRQPVLLGSILDHNWIRDALGFDMYIWAYDKNNTHIDFIKLIKGL